MLISDRGQMIRVPVEGIRFKGRATKGVTIFRTAEGERVVSVERIPDQGEDEAGEADAESTADDPSAPDGGEAPQD